jgi:hypothetical protein
MGLSAVLAAALMAACGSDDGTDGGDDTGRAETSASSPKLVRFEADRIPFTFKHPENLKVEVRRTAGRELRPRRYLAGFKRDLEGKARVVATREEQIGDIQAGVLEVEEGGSTSTSYFFSGAGGTWQIECTDDDAAACRAAVESVDFSR